MIERAVPLALLLLAACAGEVDTDETSRPSGGDDTAPPDPDAPFVDVTAGVWHSCGRRESGLVHCFGRDDRGQSTPPDSVTFVDVSAGDYVTCGVATDTSVTCWGTSEGDLDFHSGLPTTVGRRRR